VQNDHPTVKPLQLMRYLARLITPPGGIVLDPFMGSGTTGVAAAAEGLGFIGIEQDEHYFAIAQQRVAASASGERNLGQASS
jgi:site-specific DNA-methyltransferase (adenine-specific)